MSINKTEIKNKVKKGVNNLGIGFLVFLIIGGIIHHYAGLENKVKVAEAEAIITKEVVEDCIETCSVTEYLELEEKKKLQEQALQEAKELKEKADQIITK